MAGTSKTDLPVVSSNEVPAYGGAPVKMDLAQTAIEQGTGFKARKSILTQADGSSVTEYRLDVDATHTVATIAADGTATLSTSRGRVTDAVPADDALKAVETALSAALKHAPSGTAPAQEAKDLAEVMERAIKAGKYTQADVASLTNFSNSAQSLPARGARTGGISH